MPMKAPETPIGGYREAIAAHRTTWATTRQHTSPEIQEAAERQSRERLREPEENFADGRQALAELQAKAAAQQEVRPSAASRARALQRLAAETRRTDQHHSGGCARSAVPYGVTDGISHTHWFSNGGSNGEVTTRP
ncbi:hypothetical protein ACN24M_37740 [Streptomyces microflavus]|uniref:hypothetical protein n=1 Tax=Streptomyces microflavus TaxID=1919 RepID=UPI003B21D761